MQCDLRITKNHLCYARFIFVAICALAAEIHYDVGHDACVTASAMPRYGELSPEAVAPHTRAAHPEGLHEKGMGRGEEHNGA